jgi:hypothetical protein
MTTWYFYTFTSHSTLTFLRAWQYIDLAELVFRANYTFLDSSSTNNVRPVLRVPVSFPLLPIATVTQATDYSILS